MLIKTILKDLINYKIIEKIVEMQPLCALSDITKIANL